MSTEEIREPSESPNGGEIFAPKKQPKAIRVLTVMAYVLSVSMAAILLSIYYIFMWEGKPHLGALVGETKVYPEYLRQNYPSENISFELSDNISSSLENLNGNVTFFGRSDEYNISSITNDLNSNATH